MSKVKATKDPALGMKVLKVPCIADMKGDKESRRTPLDQFLFCALQLYYLEGQVHVDCERVAMNITDSKLLYENFKLYLMEAYGKEEGPAIAVRAWLQMGPTPRKEVPEGFVYLLPGYFLIQKEKDELPPKELRH